MTRVDAIDLAPWRTVPLGEIADVKLGKMLDKAKQPKGPVIPYLRNINIRWGAVDTDDLREMPFGPDELDRFGLEAGDVLVCEGGEPGRAAVWDGRLPDLKFQKAIHRVRFNVPFEPRLLVYLLELLAKTGGLERRFTGSTIKHFTREAFIQLPVPVAPLAKQRETIAEIEKQLTRLDAGVAALRRVQANLKRYRAAVLKAACEGRLVPTEAELARQDVRAYETGAELLSRIIIERSEGGSGQSADSKAAAPAPTTLGTLPEGWASASVGTVGFVQLGRQRSPKDHSGPHMRPYLRVANVYEDRLDLTDVKAMNFTPSEFKIFELRPNDVLLNEGQSLEWVGRPAIYQGEIPEACFQNTLVRFRPCASVNPRFALTVFLAFMHDGRFQKIAKWTTNIAHLGAARFAEMGFPLPPLAEQNRIVAEVDRLLTVAQATQATVSTALLRAGRLRQSILQAAFSGSLATPHA